MEEPLSILAVPCIAGVSWAADSLRFTSRLVAGGRSRSNAVLIFARSTNLVVGIQRLNRTNDLWEAQGNVTFKTANASKT
jgi:hypothetical protein